MTNDQSEQFTAFDEVASAVVELANQRQTQYQDSSPEDIADGILAGAVHYWLFSRQPCDSADCQDCQPIATADKRIRLLTELVQELALGSDYYHTINDADVGHA